MKTLTIKDIRDLGPCYDPVKYLPKDWSGDVLDILDIKDCGFEDRLWVVTRFLSDRVNRLFAVYCARQAIALIKNPDERNLNACDVAERFAYGKATREELAAANSAAWAAWADADTDDAAVAAANDAAWAVRAAARYVTWDSARNAARDAAWAAAIAAIDAADALAAASADFECYLRLLIADEEQEK